MVAPLAILPYLAVGGLTMSGLANVARGVNSGNVYQQFGRGYKALDEGYRRHLTRQGRRVNPNRAITSYYGDYLRYKTQMENSYYSALGSAGGSFGAGAMTTRWFT